MFLKLMVCIFFLNFISTPSFSARILGIAPTPSYSHQVVYRPLWKELSLRGHQLTVLTTDPINDPSLINLTEIDLHFSYKEYNKNILEISNESQNGLKMLHIFVHMFNRIIDQQLQHPEVQKLLKNESEHFDLLMVEFLHPTMTAFAKRFKCPFIGITSFDAPLPRYQVAGNPMHPALNPVAGSQENITFFNRLFSFLIDIIVNLYMCMYLYPLEQLTVNKHFGEDYPLLQDIEKDVSMLFVNADPIFHQIRPLVPTVVQIGGGIHLKPPQPIPKDLKSILDGASEGFIYFSLGTNVKAKDLPQSTRDAILEAFSELPHKILWKAEFENLPKKPDNVIISSWFPQQDVLRHSHIKLFITQGGQQSMEETIYNHVPIVGMPFFYDQITNIKKMVSKGVGLSVDHKTLTKKSFKKIILEVINNSSYRRKVEELANLAQDQPMTGLHRAVWWTEYVLRHKGAKHLRVPSMNLPLYQYYLLDVFSFFLLVVSTIFILSVLIFKLTKYFIVKSITCVKSKLKTKIE